MPFYKFDAFEVEFDDYELTLKLMLDWLVKAIKLSSLFVNPAYPER